MIDKERRPMHMRRVVVVCWGIVCLCLPLSSPAAESFLSGKLPFKASHIAIWCDTDAADGCPQYDVDVVIQDMSIVDDADVPRWKAFVDRQHAFGKLICAEMRPLTHMGRMLEYVLNNPDLQEAACRDLDLKPIPVAWMKEGPYHDTVPPFYCSNHPNYKAFLEQQMKFFAQVGVDGVMVDDGGGSPFAYSHGGCFCEYCVKGFRKYLREKYSAQQLREKGIDDPESFDYRQFILRRFGNLNSYLRQGRGGPLRGDFQRFLRVSDVELFAHLQALCSKLSGRHIPMGWDNVDCRASYAPYYPFWDVFYSEITYQNFHVDGRGPANVFPRGIIYLNKLADALGKWYTPTPGPRAWQAIMEGNLTGLLCQWIAFTYANGGALRYPRKGWIFSDATPWYYPPKEDFEPVYEFIRTHRELFDGYEPVQQVGVLYSQNRQSKYYTPLKHVCASLVDRNIPFGLAIAGDEELANRITGDEVNEFDIMLIPEPIRLIDGQQEIVDRWKAEGKAIAVERGDDVTEKLAGRIEPLVAVESDSNIWLFPRINRRQTNAPLVCHIVNAQYDAGQNQMIKQKSVVVSFSNSLWKSPGRRLAAGYAPSKITYHTIGCPAQVLESAVGSGGVRVTIPEVDLWGILVFDG